MDEDASENGLEPDPVRPEESESLEIVTAAVETLQGVVKGMRKKHASQIQTLESTIASMKAENQDLTDSNAKLEKALLMAKQREQEVRQEIASTTAAATSTKDADGYLMQADGVNLSSTLPLTSLQTRYDELHASYTHLSALRDQERAEIKRIWDGHAEQRKAYCRQIRRLGEEPNRMEGSGPVSANQGNKTSSIRQRTASTPPNKASKSIMSIGRTTPDKNISALRSLASPGRTTLGEVTNSRENTPTKKMKTTWETKLVEVEEDPFGGGGNVVEGETELDWMVRGCEETMERQAARESPIGPSQAVLGLLREPRSADVFGSGARVLAEETQLPIRAIPTRLQLANRGYEHTPPQTRSIATPATDRIHRTPEITTSRSSASSDPKRSRTWLGGNKTRSKLVPLKRKDSFEDDLPVSAWASASNRSSRTGEPDGRQQIKFRQVVLGPANIPTDLRDLQGMDVIDDARYEINPDRNGGIRYAYGEVVRNKEHRKHLKGEDCDECKRYYDAIADITPVDNAPAWRSPPEGDTDGIGTSRQKHLDQVSRHRSKHKRNPTPPGYWQTAFPSSQEVDQWNLQADRMKADKRAHMREEAEKSDGLYRVVERD